MNPLILKYGFRHIPDIDPTYFKGLAAAGELMYLVFRSDSISFQFIFLLSLLKVHEWGEKPLHPADPQLT